MKQNALMIDPVVSVVIPCFNTRSCIRDSIDSALGQIDVPVEIIVVDDGSTDGTLDLVRDTYSHDARVRPFQMPMNGGPSAARNLGFRQARGEWTALLDSDDRWEPNRLKRLLQHAGEADFIADNLMAYDAAAAVETGPVYDDLSDRFLTLTDFLRPSSPDRHDLGYLQPIVRSDFLRRHAIAYREDVRAGEDLLLNIEIMVRGGRAYYVDEPLYIYTTPVGATSRDASPHSRSTADTRPLIAALQDFRSENWSRLRQEERAAMDERLVALRANVAIGRFHRARARRQHAEMLALVLTEPSIWRKAADRLLGRG
jgi:succinoglycan biosynthesis protein ExoO